MKNIRTANLLVSFAALFCILAGWFHWFSPELTHLLYQKLFYIFISISFFLVGVSYPQKKKYAIWVAATACLVGALSPVDSPLYILKVIGIVSGAILSFTTQSSWKRGG